MVKKLLKTREIKRVRMIKQEEEELEEEAAKELLKDIQEVVCFHTIVLGNDSRSLRFPNPCKIAHQLLVVFKEENPLHNQAS